ncbi:elongator complex protein 4-like [Pollicipes pollicipes]|uniref:elongator complex protein 4-like n=1 Tax=Pollicipes pollicipes TaxID=41117 RepID=UPI0018854E93|nr:elongator complex protein 4-like [Pollicipes pollicipes]
MTSFQKCGDHAPRVMGTKPSLHSGQTIISCGIPSLDHIMDGGIPLGSLVVIEEDRFGDYARLLLSYFMSEGVCNRHPLLVSSLDADPRSMTLELPSPTDPTVSASLPSASPADQRMTIAWRYQGLPQGAPPAAGRFGQHYDLSQFIDQSVIEASDITTCPDHGPPADGPPEPDLLASLLAACERLARQAGEADATVRRVALLLRLLLRSTAAVAMVTVPTHLWTDEASVSRLRQAADISLGLESFQGTPAAASPAYSDYHGLLRLHRLSARNVLAARYHPRSADLAFKVRRKKFSVETLHLPPELSETASRAQEEGPGRPGAGCQSGRPGGPLDF